MVIVWCVHMIDRKCVLACQHVDVLDKLMGTIVRNHRLRQTFARSNLRIATFPFLWPLRRLLYSLWFSVFDRCLPRRVHLHRPDWSCHIWLLGLSNFKYTGLLIARKAILIWLWQDLLITRVDFNFLNLWLLIWIYRVLCDSLKALLGLRTWSLPRCRPLMLPEVYRLILLYSGFLLISNCFWRSYGWWLE